MLTLCSVCHEFYNGNKEYTFCPHRAMNDVVIDTDYCEKHKLVPSHYAGEVCPLCTADRRQETVGKSIRFISGFYSGERGIILHYRGHSMLAGDSFEILLRNGVRVITTERHFKIDKPRKRRAKVMPHAYR